MKMYTYLQSRKCIHCGEPIPDQKHLSLKFCDYKEQGKPSKDSCKNKYWSQKKNKDLKEYRLLVRFHKSMNSRLNLLFAHKGQLVSAEDLNRYGIDLRSPVRLNFDTNKKKHFYYIGYLIIELSNTEYKIKPNEILF